MKKFTLAILMTVLIGIFGFSPRSYAQNNTSGDIAGTVTDSTGAVIPGAHITVVNKATGAKSAATSNAAGSYRVSLLEPGTYHVTVLMQGFSQVANDVLVNAGVVTENNTKLTVGSDTTTVEVTGQAPLLHTESAEISTEFDQEQISSLPNPGNDLTFIAQTTPGAVMNTQGGYGNFASFGLPAVANTFTINGGYTNDPFLNLSDSGASNLLLGNNDIGTVTVLSNAYDAQYGGLGGTQVIEISRSGGNKFHGDATYQWNGSVLNANDYFNNQSGTKKPRSNANQWSGAIGGPIVKDKTFFFFNTEGLRVVIPVRGTVYAPNAAYMATTEANALSSEGAGAAAFYTNFFKSYTQNKYYATATPDPGDPNAVIFNSQSANFAHEAQYTGRIDQKLGSKDNVFFHATYDTGVQPTFTSLINPLFNTDSPQPQWYGQMNETHVFTPNLTNQFVFAEIYYKAVFQNTNSAAANALSPFSLAFLDGDLASNGFDADAGGADFNFPQGRHVNGYQFVDDVSWTKGKHTIKGGFYMRRDDVTDYGPQVLVTPLAEATEETFEGDEAAFGFAAKNPGADVFVQNVPSRLTQPISVYNLGVYIQDEWKVTQDFILTAGIRFEHNSNPVCHSDCFATLATNFSSLSTSATTPYDNNGGKGLINSGLYNGFSNFQKIGYEPRLGFAYTPAELNKKTTIRGGFGIFADAFPAQITGDLDNNAPENVGFTLLSPLVTGNPAGTFYPLYAPAPNSGASVVASSAVAFRSAYAAGGTLTSISATNPNFAPPDFTSPLTKISYPTYEEYNLAIEQQISQSMALSIGYVGNHTYHQPVLNNSANAYNGGGAFFPGLPTSIPNQNFAAVTQIYSGASSNYNGLILTATKHSTWLTLQLNYTYSHALDEISNGGFNGFSANSISPINPNPALLRQNYGNADYDTRQYVSGNYVINLPYYGGPKALTKGWEFAGDVFHSSGLPFTFTDSTTASTYLANYGGALPAQQVGHISTKCSSGRPSPTTQCSDINHFISATNFGQQARNQIFGPSYTDTDLSVYKSISMPKYESVHLKLGVQFFNLFNHPNFAQPAHDLAPCYNGPGGSFGTCQGTSVGTITSAVNPPTSILGSFLGGDASPRLIQLKANINF